MPRRIRRSNISLSLTQDPGKDLFAYLFLLIMVFSFMLLMSMEEKHNSISRQDGPIRNPPSGHSSLATVSMEKIGRLVKENGVIYLVFGHEQYHPQKDIDRLNQENRITVISDKDGNQKKILYLEKDKGNKVLLAEYLEAFQYLSRQGIGVAFAERVK